jgi:hypothetical protein
MIDPNQAPPQDDVLADQGQPEAAARGLGMMNWLRNTRPGQLLTDISMGAAVVLPGAGAAALAFNAEPVGADGNIPARSAEAQASYTPTRPCESTDSNSPNPQWHASYNFKTPNGKEGVHKVKPGGLVRFVVRVAGGNVEAFNMYAMRTTSSKDIEVLKRGSHPAWSKSAGDPHWVVKELCHWKDKRNINFLVKVDSQAKLGSQACLSTTETVKADDVVEPVSFVRHCLKVK